MIIKSNLHFVDFRAGGGDVTEFPEEVKTGSISASFKSFSQSLAL